MGKSFFFKHSSLIILLTIESYLALQQHKWIIMLMAPFWIEDTGGRLWDIAAPALRSWGFACHRRLAADVRCFVPRLHRNLCVCVCFYLPNN